MDPTVNALVNLFLRWIHIVAGILWIGHLYFFNFVNAQFQAKVEGPTKKAINPELLPRALYWFRWGAMWTWVTGILLLGLIYYHGKIVFEETSRTDTWLWLAIVLVTLVVGFLIYNAIMKAIANKVVAAAICLVLFAGVYLLLERVGGFGGRSLFIHAGGILGTMMFLNVWMVIWPNQQKIIGALKAGTPLAPDSPEVKIAGLRSRHNTFMSVPLVLFMISNHYPEMFSNTTRDLCALGVVVLGFIAVRLLYGKAGKVQGM